MKKIALMVLLMMILILAMTQTAFASEASLLSATSSGKSFSKAWQATKSSNTGGKHILTYGYNTTLINEDYAYAYSNGWKHRSKVKNDRETFKGPIKWANDGWSDIEVRHKGSSIKYWNMKVTP